MREDAKVIINKTILDVMPDKAVHNSLQELSLQEPIFVIAIGKAAWVMAKAAKDYLSEQLQSGIIVTKYGHSKGEIRNFEIIESGHPTPDENSVIGAKKVMAMIEKIPENGTILFLLSGGGSSLVELPLPGLTLEDIQKVTEQLLYCGAGISEINLIRKKLSAIKGGKLGSLLGKRRAYSVILSDVLGDNADMIASGITYKDVSTVEDIKTMLNKYQLKLSEKVYRVLMACTSNETVEIENHVVGSVVELCEAAAKHACELGYQPYIISTNLSCEAREAGQWIASMVDSDKKRPYAIIAGGETVVKIVGSGLGGRNQEIALSAAYELQGKKDVLLFSLGSDGTDGPTDAAGGIVDGETIDKLLKQGINSKEVLDNNDSYHALKAVDGLIITGATGTNVNDVTVLLCR